MKFLDREPITRRVENRITSKARKTREAPGKRIRNGIPEFDRRNFGGGRLIGAAGGGLLTIIEDFAGIPFGASSDIVDVRPAEGRPGAIYTINVNAPTQNIAESRAFIDSTTGFTSYLTDNLDIKDAAVMNQRVLRDTYQIEVLVEE